MTPGVTEFADVHQGWSAAIRGLSDVLADLYRLAPISPAGEFQDRALDAAAAVLGFDSAIWAAGVVTAEGPVVHTVYAYRQPPEMMAQWDRLKQYDTMFVESLRRPGETVRGTSSGPEGCAPFVPEVTAHARRYGMEHVLGTVVASPVLRLMEGIAFYRADPARAFTEPERLFKQCLVPHLAEAWRINRMAAVHCERRLAVSEIGCLAICDGKGRLYAAGPQFADLMRAEWPTWSGPDLPREVGAKWPWRHVGRGIVLSAEALNDMWLLRARSPSPIDQLSQRELEVARKFARGLSYQDISRVMHISPATVRNHLKNIYAKLAIGDKAALANMVQRAGERVTTGAGPQDPRSSAGSPSGTSTPR